MEVDMPHLRRRNVLELVRGVLPSLGRRASWSHSPSRGRGSNLPGEGDSAAPGDKSWERKGKNRKQLPRPRDNVWQHASWRCQGWFPSRRSHPIHRPGTTSPLWTASSFSPTQAWGRKCFQHLTQAQHSLLVPSVFQTQFLFHTIPPLTSSHRSWKSYH